MIYLIAGIFCSASLVLFFRKFADWNIRTPQAIAVNYLVCVVTGIVVKPESLAELGSGGIPPWWHIALILGTLFISIFTLSSLTAVEFGASVAAMGMKLGLVFPVILGLTFYGESGSWPKYVGIVLAFAAMILASMQSTENKENHKHHSPLGYLLPLVVFIGSGFCDSFVQYSQKTYFSGSAADGFLIVLFLVAGTGGVLRCVYDVMRNNDRLEWKNLGAGIMLGIPNYFSIWFLVKALQTGTLDSASTFVLTNIGTVLLAAILSVVLFREKFSKNRIAALALGVAAIALISLG